MPAETPDDVDTYHNLNVKSSRGGGSTVQQNYGDSPWINTDWHALADREIANAIYVTDNVIKNTAKNVIMFLGDGLGVTTTASARVYHAQMRNLDHEDIYLSYEKFPHVGLSRVRHLRLLFTTMPSMNI